MTEQEIRALCQTFPGTTHQVQWGNDLVFKVAGKMYACIGLNSGHFSFKCSDDRFVELTEMPGIKPAPYLARALWIQVDPSQCVIGTDEIRKLLSASYDLVVAKLPRRTRQMLANGEER